MCWGQPWSNRGAELRLLSLTAAGGCAWSVGLGPGLPRQSSTHGYGEGGGGKGWRVTEG